MASHTASRATRIPAPATSLRRRAQDVRWSHAGAAASPAGSRTKSLSRAPPRAIARKGWASHHRRVTCMREMTRSVVAITLIVALGGCAAMREERAKEKENLLSAAGFQMKPADTPNRVAHLQTLTPLKLVPHTRASDGKLLYVLADPKGCQCLYVGDEIAYQRYRALAQQQKIAQEQMVTAQLNTDSAMDWGLWGPYWW